MEEVISSVRKSGSPLLPWHSAVLAIHPVFPWTECGLFKPQIFRLLWFTHSVNLWFRGGGMGERRQGWSIAGDYFAWDKSGFEA